MHLCRVFLAKSLQHSFATTAARNTGGNLTLLNVENGVCRITLNSEKKRNALSLEMITELTDRLNCVANDKSVKAIILDHTGLCFSAGHDLKQLTHEQGEKCHAEVFQQCTKMMNLVQDISLPVIAEVNGVATAAGCQLVATCDLAVATDTSKFAVPGVFIGLFCSTPGVALARSVNRKQALKMLLTGDPINAQEAVECGLINQAVKVEDLKQTTDDLAARITRHSKHAIGLGKNTFYQQIKQDRDQAYNLAESVMVNNLAHVDAQEGISSFFEKRKPTWKE